MKSAFWLDLTPLWWCRGQSLEGISRTIFYYARGLKEHFPSLRYCRFDSVAEEFIPLTDTEVSDLLDSFQITRTCAGDVLPTSEASSRFAFLEDWLPRMIKSFRPMAVIVHQIRRAVRALRSGNVIFRKNASFSNTTESFSNLPPSSHAPHSFLALARGDILLVMGLLWCQIPWDSLRREGARIGFHSLTVIYDLIPIHFPEMLNNAIEPIHLERVLRASSLVFSISDFTAEDVERFAQARGFSAPAARRIHLGGELPCPPPANRPERFEGLRRGGFVLFVSSLNHRKNHEMLYAIWRELLETHRDTLIPLIFVGGVSSHSEPFVRLMRMTKRLYPHYLRYEADVCDDELQWLYANCRFTVFPSFYEGWGLPVVESLQHGKFCISSNATSLPEAGAGFTELIRPFDYYGWKEAILRYLQDDELLVQKEQYIRQNFHAMNWEQSVDRFASNIKEEFPWFNVSAVEDPTCV